MRAVVQRVSEARVEVDGAITGQIGAGLLILLGVAQTDTERDAEYLVRKVTGLRVFQDADQRMNLSVRDAGGALLVVSQFTLYGDIRKGMRPSFDRAAKAEVARKLYEYFLFRAKETGIPIQTGVFQASMSVHSVNIGPITLICDSLENE